MAEKNVSKSWMSYVHWLIGILIMAVGYVVPVSEPLTPMGAKILAIFVGMIYLWCTVNPIGGSFLSLFAVSVAGYAPFSQVIADGVANSNWTLLFFSCILFMSAIESGMPNYIANAIFKATQGLVTGRPMVLVFIIMFAAYILSGLTDGIPSILMFWAVSYAIIEDLKLAKTDTYSMFLVISVFLGAILGNALFPFKGAMIIIISAFEAATSITVAYGPYILINFICSMVIMALYCISGKYIFRIDLTKVKDINGKILANGDLQPMNIAVKAHLLGVFGFIITVLLTSFLPQDLVTAQFLASLGTEGIAIFWLIVVFIVNDKGQGIIKMPKVMKTMPWGALFMVMAAVYLAGALKNKDVTGVIPWLKVILNPILGGHSEIVFATLLIIISMVLTCFFHNGALGNMLMPILAAICSANDYNAVAIAVIMAMTINIAYLTPSASNYAPLLHSNKEYVSAKNVWTYGLYFEILSFIIFMLIGLPLAQIMM